MMNERVKVWLLCILVFVLLVIAGRMANQHRDPKDHDNGQMGSTDYP